MYSDFFKQQHHKNIKLELELKTFQEKPFKYKFLLLLCTCFIH